MHVIEDACAGVSASSVADAYRKFACERVELVSSSSAAIAAVPEVELEGEVDRKGHFSQSAQNVLAELGGRLDFLFESRT